MITNIVAVVTVFLTTNSVERFPQHMIADPLPGHEMLLDAVFRGHLEKDPDPKEKWVTTTIAEIHELTFDFDGYKSKHVYQNVLTNWTVHFDKSDQWVKSATNSPIPSMWPTTP